MGKERKHKGFIRRHSLSLVSVGVLIMWILLYSVSSPSTHTGSFFGNAIADWTGVGVMVITTKYLYEKGSSESRRPPHGLLSPIRERLRDHSLSIFLLITGIGWIALYVSMDSEANRTLTTRVKKNCKSLILRSTKQKVGTTKQRLSLLDD
jgi:hypothetical protein